MDEAASPAPVPQQGLSGPLGLACFLMLCASLRAFKELTTALGDTDDAMRLVQVRALLHGRPWWDLIEPRLGPPHGLAVHWSRLIDGPIAALMWLFQSLLGQQLGELAARTAWPLLLFIPMAIALLRASRMLGGARALWFAAAIMPLCWYLDQQFTPSRLDHHNVQLGLVAWTMLCALTADRARSAAIMGALTGISLAIGFETLPVIVWAGGLIALRYVFFKDGAKPAIAFGLALAASTVAAFVIQTPPIWWTRMACDALGLNMVLGACVAGVGLAFAAATAGEGWGRRAIAVALVGAAALGIFLSLHPVCVGGPYAEMDPRINDIWLKRVGEAAPAWDWLRAQPTEALSGMALPFGALMGALVAIGRGERDPRFIAATVLLTLCTIVGCIEIRSFMLATAAAIPLAAWMVARIKRLEIATPMAGGLALGLLFSPVATLSIGRLVTPVDVSASEKSSKADQSDCLKVAAMDGLSALPPGLVLADLDSGPNILALTHHTAVGAPYHRLGQQIYDVMTVFNASNDHAAAIVQREGADYVAVCKTGVVFSDHLKGSFGAALLDGASPPWLTPLNSTRGDYALFRVRRDLLAANDGLKGREEAPPSS